MLVEVIDRTANLSSTHRGALKWFAERTGQDVPWPQPLADGTFLVNKAKGIHKPAGWTHALSIRQSLGGPYPDKDPVVRADGSWEYQYFQEASDPTKRDAQFTNQALLACQRDRVPIGVMRQVKPKPNPLYRVLGLALVTDWRDGYFILEGMPAETTASAAAAQISEGEVDFTPDSLEDARNWVVASIVRRQGQGQFRAKVLRAYGYTCAITGCDAAEAIEAAHIFPYRGKATNLTANGLPLRADIHTLYDLGLLTVHPVHSRVELSPELLATTYKQYLGVKVRSPLHIADNPAQAALQAHYDWATSKW